MKFQKFIVYAWLLLDVIGIAVLIPAFPELKQYYWINDFQVTLWLTLYSFGAFFAAPVLGQLSDKLGRKKILAWCITGTALSYLMLLLTQQYRIFLLSRIINGITWGNISILQAILTDISPDQETKTKNFWLMGAFFGVWFIIWPVIWGLLLKFFDVTGIFWFGAIFALIELFLIIVHFHNTNTLQHDKTIIYKTITVFMTYLKREEMRNLLLSFFSLGIWWFITSTSLSLFMNTQFGTSWTTYGYFLGTLGVISAINMGFLLPKFWAKYLSSRQLIIWIHSILIVWYILLWTVHHYARFVLLFFVISFLAGIYMPIYNTQIMSHAKPHEVGELSWLLWGAQSLFMFVWPLIGGLLLTYWGNIFRWATVFFVWSAILMLKRIIKNKI